MSTLWSINLKLVPLEDRINRFLVNFPNAKKIPLHPDDYNRLKFEGRLDSFSLPVTKLGTFKEV